MSGSALRAFLRRYMPLFLCIGLLVVTALLPQWFGGRVFERVVTLALISVVLTVGLHWFSGNSGLMSFGHVAFMAMGAYATIWFSLSPAQKAVTLPDMPKDWLLYQIHLPFVGALLAAAALVAVVGAAIGGALIRLRGAAFTIATFAVLLVTHTVALHARQLTRGARTVIGVPPYTTLWVALAAAVVVVIGAYLYKESGLGLQVRATREDETAAAAIGINVNWVRWTAWVPSVAVTALAGGLWAHFITTFSPLAFFLERAFLVIAMLVIGGAESVTGAVVGALGVAMVSEVVRSIENWIAMQSTIAWLPDQAVGLTEAAVALAMILVLIARPRGVTGGSEWPAVPPPAGQAPPHHGR